MDYTTLEKSPDDDMPYTFDYTDEDVFLTDPIATGAATKWDGTAISGITVGSPTVIASGRKLQARISGGTHGVDYEVKMKATSTSAAYDRDIFIKLQVRRAV